MWSLAVSVSADTPPSVTPALASVVDASSLYPDRASPEASVARGDIAFQHYCALCHGKAGAGDGRAAKIHNPRPANLTVSDKNKAYKELIVRKGGAALGRSAAMPPWNEELTEEQITDIVNFLQTLVPASVSQDAAAK
jgi:mono/diheme cytochrome c family protein